MNIREVDLNTLVTFAYVLASIVYLAISPKVTKFKEVILGIVFQVEKWYSVGENAAKADKALALIYSRYPLLSKLLPKSVLLYIVKWAVSKMKQYAGNTSESLVVATNKLAAVRGEAINSVADKLINTVYNGDSNLVHNEQITQVCQDLQNEVCVKASAAINEARKVSADITIVGKHKF